MEDVVLLPIKRKILLTELNGFSLTADVSNILKVSSIQVSDLAFSN